MSLVPKIGHVKAFLNASRIGKNQVKTYATSYHYPDWKPGPYPKTKEEREAAAKKYGMLPEEYEPYPDDGSGYGDYPMLEPVSDAAKDHYLPYNQTGLIYRNIGEPIPIDFLGYTSERYNTNWEKNFTVPKGLFYQVLGILVGCGFVSLFTYPKYRLMAPKQWPNKGEIHYTFDLVE